MKKRVYQIIKSFGFDGYIFLYSLKGLPSYLINLFILNSQIRTKKESIKIKSFYPVLHEKFELAGNNRGHYFHMDLLVAQKIYKNNPKRHIDIGSRIDGFVAHVASFRSIEIIDFRQLTSKSNNISFIQSDLMIDNESFHSTADSISCLHALEHFGLGRYGDPVNSEGYKIGFQNIVKILKNGGTFYFAVPIGKEGIVFNAHRIFSLKTLIDIFNTNRLQISTFSYVDDFGDLYTDIDLSENAINSNLNCNYGCGIFELKK